MLTPRHPTRTWPRSAFADAIWFVGPVCLSSLLAAGKPQGTHSLTPPIINYASSMCVRTGKGKKRKKTREDRPTHGITQNPDKEPPIAATLPMKHFEVCVSATSRAFGMCVGE